MIAVTDHAEGCVVLVRRLCGVAVIPQKSLACGKNRHRKANAANG